MKNLIVRSMLLASAVWAGAVGAAQGATYRVTNLPSLGGGRQG
jgi:hypothetical protein